MKKKPLTKHINRRSFLKYTAFMVAAANAPFSMASIIDPVDYDSWNINLHIKDSLPRKRLFNQSYKEDIFLDKKLLGLLHSSIDRLKRMQKFIGYANFSLLNFDHAIKISKAYPQIGFFTKEELDFLEMIFYSQVRDYGFMGEKPIKTLTGKIDKSEVKKIPYTGNYLYKGKPVDRYNKIKKHIGEDVVLTSGVRNVMKQFLLFLDKAKSSSGNLSMASRSLAPPGYSFHGVGDFDIGQKGYGIYNFTEKFTHTKVYKKLIELGYIKFRYEKDNNLGVRFEPWHIEVV